MSGDEPEDMVDEERKRICCERRCTVFGTKVIGWAFAIRITCDEYLK